jgi:hypothetical protein
LNENPPLQDSSVYSKRRKNGGYIHTQPKSSQSSRRYRKNSGYKHAKPGAFAQCQETQAKAKQAVEKIYSKHKQGESHANCTMEEWYAKELREIEEAEKRCDNLRQDDVSPKEVKVQQ